TSTPSPYTTLFRSSMAPFACRPNNQRRRTRGGSMPQQDIHSKHSAYSDGRPWPRVAPTLALVNALEQIGDMNRTTPLSEFLPYQISFTSNVVSVRIAQ